MVVFDDNSLITSDFIFYTCKTLALEVPLREFLFSSTPVAPEIAQRALHTVDPDVAQVQEVVESVHCVGWSGKSIYECNIICFR